jgi:hypothetical protein
MAWLLMQVGTQPIKLVRDDRERPGACEEWNMIGNRSFTF